MSGNGRPADLQHLLDVLKGGRSGSAVELLRLRENVWNIARTQLRGEDGLRRVLDSEDLTQDALLQLVQHVDGFRGTTWREFFAFVVSVLAQQKTDLARYHGRIKRTADEDDLARRLAERSSPSPSEILAAREDSAKLDELIAALPPSLGWALRQRLMGKSYETIADEGDLSYDVARQRVSRALAALKQQWQRRAGD